MDPTTKRADAPLEPTPTIDVLARGLARASPRRAVLRHLAGALAAVGLAVPATADAQRAHRRRAPKPDAASHESPRKHKHRCAPGLTPCVIGVAKHGKHHPHVCVDLETDPEHCGACDHACAAGQACHGGACACMPDCDRRVCGTDGCGGSCGECGGDDICANGRCESICPDGQTYCNGVCIASNKCCNDDDCASDQTCCQGTCRDTQIDNRNCGGCDVTCSGQLSCNAGECCLARGSDCTSSAECCGTDVCDPELDTCNQCGQVGDDCLGSGTANCCAGLTCTNRNAGGFGVCG